MRTVSRKVLTASAAHAPGSKVHAWLEHNVRTVCKQRVIDTSNAEFRLDHPSNCRSCEQAVRQRLANGTLILR